MPIVLSEDIPIKILKTLSERQTKREGEIETETDTHTHNKLYPLNCNLNSNNLFKLSSFRKQLSECINVHRTDIDRQILLTS